MVTFTETTFHELLDSDKTTPSTVLDSDGKLKQSLHNMLPTTDVTDTDYWTTNGLSSAGESGTSPSGKTAYLLTENTSNSTHETKDSISFSANRYYGFKFDVKSNGRDVSFESGSAAFGAAVKYDFDLDAGTVTTVTNGTNDSAFIEELSDGWYTCTVYLQATTTASSALVIRMNNGSSGTYTGDGTSGIYVSRPRVYEASVHVPVERVENGTFDSDVSGWLDGSDSGGAVSWNSSGYMDVVNTTGTARANLTLALVAGETYRFSVNVVTAPAGGGAIQIQPSGGSTTTLFDIDVVGTGTHVTTYTAETTSNYTLAVKQFSAGTTTVDNVSLTKVIDDGIQNDLDGEDFIETSGSAVYHGALEYNADGSFRGIQSFESRTNYNKNSSAFLTAGSSPARLGQLGSGNPGSLPDTWFTQGFPKSSIEVVGIGEDPTLNIEYIDLRFNGTPTGTIALFPSNAANGASASDGDVVTISSYLALVGGDTTNLTTFQLGDHRHLSDTTYHSNRNISISTPTSDLDRYHITDDSLDDGDGSGAIGLAYGAIKVTNNGGAVDFTLRVAGFQFEKGSSPSPYIPTAGSTRNRGGDKILKPLSEFGFNKTEFTILAEFESAGSDGADYPRIFQIDDGDNSDRVSMSYSLSDNITVGSAGTGITGGSFTVKTGITAFDTYRVMAAFDQSRFAASEGGATVAEDTSVEYLENMTSLNLGKANTGSELNGHLKKFIIWPKVLSDGTLEAESE